MPPAETIFFILFKISFSLFSEFLARNLSDQPLQDKVMKTDKMFFLINFIQHAT